MTRYLTVEDLIAACNRFELGPMADLGLLASAAARPRASAFGDDSYPSVHEKAAALLESVVNNQTLVDGNKRLALVAMVTFLDINGYALDLTDDDAFTLVMAVADGSLVGVTSIAARLRIKPLD